MNYMRASIGHWERKDTRLSTSPSNGAEAGEFTVGMRCGFLFSSRVGGQKYSRLDEPEEGATSDDHCRPGST